MAAQLIVALDLPRKEDALVLARELQGAVPWCKVGMELFTLAGPDIIRELHDLGFHVFLDMKFYDIPHTVAQAVKAAAAAGAELLTLHCQGGERMCSEARIAAEQLAAEGIHARVINIHTIKPLDEDIILKAAKECGKIVTAEEHNVIGGLGEAVCAVLSEKCPTPVRRVGVQDKFGCSGPAWDLLKLYGLDAATICKTAKEMLGK